MDTSKAAVEAAQRVNEAALLKQHDGLLHKFSKACYARLQAAGVEIEYEDVYQEMGLTLVKASRTYDSAKGVGFTAYFGRACYNNFNKLAEKLIAEQTTLGLVRACELEKAGDEGEAVDIFEAMFADDAELSPEELMERAQDAQIRIATLSQPARKMLAYLSHPTPNLRAAFEAEVEEMLAAREAGETVRVPSDLTFAFIGRYLKMDVRKVREVKAELMTIFRIR